MRKAARAAGGTLNDGYLAGLLGGIRLYHEALELDIDQIPLAIPISTRSRRKDSASAAGNLA